MSSEQGSKVETAISYDGLLFDRYIVGYYFFGGLNRATFRPLSNSSVTSALF